MSFEYVNTQMIMETCHLYTYLKYTKTKKRLTVQELQVFYATPEMVMMMGKPEMEGKT